MGRINSDEIIELLKLMHCKDIWATELSFSGGRRRCDFWAMKAQKSKNYECTAYEIKTSLADFKRETYDKQKEARLFSDKFYFVAPEGVIPIELIPDWAGLYEVVDKRDGGHFISLKQSAVSRSKDAPSWELVVSLLRYSGERRRDIDSSFIILKKNRDELSNRLKLYQRHYGYVLPEIQ